MPEPKIIAITPASGVKIRQTQGNPLPVLAWALLDSGVVRPLYQGRDDSAELVVWTESADDVFEGYGLTS